MKSLSLNEIAARQPSLNEVAARAARKAITPGRATYLRESGAALAAAHRAELVRAFRAARRMGRAD